MTVKNSSSSTIHSACVSIYFRHKYIHLYKQKSTKMSKVSVDRVVTDIKVGKNDSILYQNAMEDKSTPVCIASDPDYSC